MRLYLDNNIYAHAQELGLEAELRSWLREGGNRVVLSDTLLGEALRIKDTAVRHDRLMLLGEVPSVRAGSLGELQSREFVNEVRRLRPDWRRLPVGDETEVRKLKMLRKKGWAALGKRSEELIRRTHDYSAVEEGGVQGALAGQRTLRQHLLKQRNHVREVELGSVQVSFRRLELDDPDDFCRFESLLSWYQATFADFRRSASSALTSGRICDQRSPRPSSRRSGRTRSTLRGCRAAG